MLLNHVGDHFQVSHGPQQIVLCFCHDVEQGLLRPASGTEKRGLLAAFLERLNLVGGSRQTRFRRVERRGMPLNERLTGTPW